MSERPGIVGIELAASNPDALAQFYCDVLDFSRESDESGVAIVRLGETTVRLRQGNERPMPPDSRSNDAWFRHLALVVDSVAHAHERLQRANVEAISRGPQRLPAWNPASADIEAFYFRDPDGHPIECIAFPPGKAKRAWPGTAERCFRGIDHTAVVATNTADSDRFYGQRLGLEIVATAHNFGAEQEQLSGLRKARVLITTFAGASTCGLETLEYIEPRDGRAFPGDTTERDLWFSATCLRGVRAERAGELLRDPAGHFVRIV